MKLFFSQLGWELFRLFARKRTYIGFGVFLAVEMLFFYFFWGQIIIEIVNPFFFSINFLFMFGRREYRREFFAKLREYRNNWFLGIGSVEFSNSLCVFFR